MKKFIPFSLVLLSVIPALAHATESAKLREKLQLCQAERSPLLRLDCYDALFAAPTKAPEQTHQTPRSESAQLAYEQEMARKAHTTEFIVTNSGGDNPKIVITAPAIGSAPPRPILAFSCIDNITRMQIIFPMTPMSSHNGRIHLITDNDQFGAIWFVRDNGFTLEASRGLPGIQDIKRILNADTLQFSSKDKKVDGLRFTISGISDVIKPLRTQCRW